MDEQDNGLSDQEIFDGAQNEPSVDDESHEPESSEPLLQSEPEGKNILLPALQAQREKTRRYTDELASVNERLTARETAFEEQLRKQQEFFDERFSQLERSIRPQQPQAPQEQHVDWFDDPEKAFSQRFVPIEQRLSQEKLDRSFLLAEDKYGEETLRRVENDLVKAALNGDAEALSTLQRINADPHPYRKMMQEHEKQQISKEMGADPAAYRERVRQEILAEMQSSSSQPQQNSRLPSVNRSSGTTGQGGVAEGLSDQEIFDSTPIPINSRR